MSVRVVARVRPLLKTELDKDIVVTASGVEDGSSKGNTIVTIPNPKNEGENFNFQFNSVYEPEASQQELFEKEVSPTIKHIFNGFDVTLFAYGVTGTGKTYTMRGGKSLAERGVIPRLLSGIYRRGRKIEKDSAGETSVAITMSYYEIYNDKVFDLFEPPEKRTMSGLQLRDNGGKTVVVGLTERPCESLKEFEKLYDQANVNRSTSATKLNAHSSRSHAILCVKVAIITGDETRISTASAIDLAGSEDNRRTDNGKERLVESASINKSLFVLAQCVEAISKKQNRIPYRESKMTRILSLGQNNGLTVMILNIAPVKSYHLDTLSSLNFANRTKRIEVREVENEPIFKGCSRPVAAVPTVTGPAIHQRQALRPLATAVHNTHVHGTRIDDKADKPAKQFSVYSDMSKSRNSSHQQPQPQPRRSDAPKRSSPLKRGSEAFVNNAKRPSKIARASPPPFDTKPTLSQSAIEDLIEKRVNEIFATRALDQPSVSSIPPDISDEVKRRLELLEQKIEGKDDARSEGLTFLLMAKQHYVRGEEQSALKMYELAQDSFPDNKKLEAKIQKLRQSIKEKKEAGRKTVQALEKVELPRTLTKLPDVQIRSEPKVYDYPHEDRDAEYQPAQDSADESDNRPSRPPRRKKKTTRSSSSSSDPLEQPIPHPNNPLHRPRPKQKHLLCLSRATSLPTPTTTSVASPLHSPFLPTVPPQQTPRTKQLLHIINTRDLAQIRLLRGVGAKKAEAIIEAMCTGEDEDDDDEQEGSGGLGSKRGGMKIEDLGQLGRLKGVGVKTVENMRAGLGPG